MTANAAYKQATEICKKMRVNATLVTIQSSAEQSFLNGKLPVLVVLKKQVLAKILDFTITKKTDIAL